MSSSSVPSKPITCLSSSVAAKIDELLMSPEYGFSIDQLMELAGLSCAQAIEHFYPVKEKRKVLIVCGPGNNGGDGLVCARHLSLFGYDVAVLYPKPAKNELYKRLLQYLRVSYIPIIEQPPEDFTSYDLLVDAIFGFSFDPKDGIREPYKDIIKRFSSLSSSLPIISIDVPSGWDVSEGDVLSLGFQPDCLISLTAPKECARKWKGRYHALGGRFMSEKMLNQFDIRLPLYPGSMQYRDISQMKLVDEGESRGNKD